MIRNIIMENAPQNESVIQQKLPTYKLCISLNPLQQFVSANCKLSN
jgi:hypothetical protein